MDETTLNTALAQDNAHLERQLRLARAQNQTLAAENAAIADSSAAKIVRWLQRVERTARWSIRRLLRKHAAGVFSIRTSDAAEIARSGLFDVAWYQQRYPEVERAGRDPIAHYLKRGASQFLDPSAIFDTDWYAAANGLLFANENPLLHYIRSGAAAGLRPNPFLDPRRVGVAAAAQDGDAAAPKFEPGVAYRPTLDANKKTVLVVSHDASRTGAPAIALAIVQELRRTFRYNVVCVLIDGGELTDLFDAAADYLIGPLYLKRRDAFDLESIARFAVSLDPRPAFALVNSIDSRRLLEPLARAAIPTVCLIHEFSSTWRPRDAFVAARTWAKEIVFPAQIVADDAATVLPRLPELSPMVAGQCPSEIPQQSGAAEALKAVRGREVMRKTSPTQKIVMGAGYVSFRKGVDLFLACAGALASKPGPDIRFVWFGDGYDPDRDLNYAVFLSDYRSRAALGDRAVVHEAVPNLPELYEHADLFFLSSRLDPLPNVVLDAMRRGIPVVCFDRTSGFADILKSAPETAECVVPYLDVDAAAAAIGRLLADDALHASVSRRVRQLAEERFSADRYIAALEEAAARATRKMAQCAQDIATIQADDTFAADFFRQPSDRADRATLIARYVHESEALICNRRPAPGFDPIAFGAANPSPTGSNPLAEFIRAGNPAGSWNFEVIEPNRAADRAGGMVDLKAALHIHVYYVDLLDEILQAMEGNASRCDLFITTDTAEKAQAIAAACAARRTTVAEILLTPNRGRDIEPLLAAMPKMTPYDIVGHLHTKKSLDVVDVATIDRWRELLLANLLGGGHRMMDRILARTADDPTLGLVFPADPNALAWGINRAPAAQLAETLGVAFSEETSVFPVGTMFWARPAALQPLMALQPDDFPPEPLPYDGSVLHAIERLLPAIARHRGFRVAVTSVPGLSR